MSEDRVGPYNATKMGVIGVAKSVALEVAKEGITINLICPTTVRTPMVQPVGGHDVPDDLVRRMMRANPIPQPWIEPEDSAARCGVDAPRVDQGTERYFLSLDGQPVYG